jgi:hypothetical protein
MSRRQTLRDLGRVATLTLLAARWLIAGLALIAVGLALSL